MESCCPYVSMAAAPGRTNSEAMVSVPVSCGTDISTVAVFWFYSRVLQVGYYVSPTLNAGIGNLIWFYEATQAQKVSTAS